MTIIERLPEIVYPIVQVNKVNEIVDVINETSNTSFTALNPALTPVEGVATWTVTHNLGTENVNCTIYDGDNLVIAKISIVSENAVSVSFNSSSSIDAETYKIVIFAIGSVGSGGGGGSITVDNRLLPDSENPVQNKVLYPCLSKFISSQEVMEVPQSSGDMVGFFEYFSNNSLFSDGPVQLRFSRGDYSIPGSLLTIRINNPNLDFRIVVGSGARIYANSTYNTSNCFDISSGTNVEFSFEGNGLISGNSEGSIISTTRGVTRITGQSEFSDFKYALRAIDDGIIVADQFCNVHDGDTAFFADGGNIIIKNDSPWSSHASLYNLSTGFAVAFGGVIKCRAEFDTNNVETWTSQAIGTYTENGAILGVRPINS